MKILKKVLIAIMIMSGLMVVAPTLLQINDLGYTVEAASVKISKTKYTMNKGESYTLKVTGTKKKVTWKSSNKKIVTVNSKGKITAKKKGTATITAKVGSKKYKCKVKVETPSINKTNLVLESGATYTLKIKNTTQKVKWSTSNKNVVTVDSKGKITTYQSGTATVTAKVGKKQLKCKITVKGYEGNIVLSYEELNDNRVVIEFYNKNKVKLDYITAKIQFYKNGKLLDVKTVSTVCLGAGRYAYTTAYKPYDSNAKQYLDFDKIMYTITDAKIYQYVPYNDMYSKVSIESNTSADSYTGVISTVKNNGDKNISSISLGCIYYKDGKVIGYSTGYAYDLGAYQTDFVKFSKPYVSGEGYVDFDSYTVVINDAHSN